MLQNRGKEGDLEGRGTGSSHAERDEELKYLELEMFMEHARVGVYWAEEDIRLELRKG